MFHVLTTVTLVLLHLHNESSSEMIRCHDVEQNRDRSSKDEIIKGVIISR